MLYTDYTEKILGLKDVIVTKVENINEEVHIFLDMKLETQVCPHCRHETKRTHDYRIQIVKDLSNFGASVYLHVRKRRYYCPHSVTKALIRKSVFFQDTRESRVQNAGTYHG
jgi:transposase